MYTDPFETCQSQAEVEAVEAAEKGLLPRRHAVIRVDGMTCSNCSGAVERALNAMLSTEQCQVDLINEKASITYRGLPCGETSRKMSGTCIALTAQMLCDEIEDIGFEAKVLEDAEVLDSWCAGGRAKLHLLHLGVCDKLDGELSQVQAIHGVLELSSNEPSKLCVIYDPMRVGARDLLAKVRSMGFLVELDNDAEGTSARSFWEAIPTGLPTAVFLTSCIILVSEMLPCFELPRRFLGTHLIPGLPCLTALLCALATPVQLYCGWRFHAGAYHSLKSGVWDMNLLISLGTGICFVYSLVVVLIAVSSHFVGHHMHCKPPPPSYFESPCLVITFILVGKSLEAWARSGASQSLRQLMTLKPAVAHLLPDTKNWSDEQFVTPTEIPLQLVQRGDVLQIFPGQVAPTDGVMISESGSAEFDEALLTGESRPVVKSVGSAIIGGSKCLRGRVEMRVEKLGTQTMLSQITSLIEHAQLSRAPVQQVADSIAFHFVPGIVALAFATWTVWYFLVYKFNVVSLASILDGRTSSWPELDRAFFVLEHGLTVLLVACPCALGLATPTAVMAATGVAAKHGILVRTGAVPLELGSKVHRVVLDKTGTLTNGKPKLVQSAATCSVAKQAPPQEGSTPDLQELAGWKELLAAFRKAQSDAPATGKSSHVTDDSFTWLPNPVTPELLLPESKSQTDAHNPSPSESPCLPDDSTMASESEAADLTESAIASSFVSDQITTWEVLRNEAECALWWAIGSSEMSSEHPLAKELVEASLLRAPCALTKPSYFENRTGLGLRCVLSGGLQVEIASASHVLLHDPGSKLHKWVEAAKAEGSTVVAVAVEGVPLAAFALRDTLAPYARACVAELERSGIEVWMCTGDHRKAAELVAHECGINLDRVVANALPGDKVRTIERLQTAEGHIQKCYGATPDTHLKKEGWKKKAIVAMVGDGINDAPALATADLGVAIGAGQNITVDAADIVLVRSDLRDLPTFFALSRRTLATVWFNFFWAFVFNACSLPVAAGVFWSYHLLMTPQIACSLMLGSSLFVVLTSLMLKGFKPIELPCET
eukprot:TRINITY_DN15368_c0_g1_i2.p1 TRINITY_DN15368_c0_g1~~TRINITY_DN15368_c0_g1_i2.p1  ORF type:complete len:1056 (-),score=163.21 TRINITY_DN15368_c0_g1_i2:61-3228(-)